MVKFLLINPANRLFSENYFWAGIRAGISARVPCNVIDNVSVTESKWPMSETPLTLFMEILTQLSLDQNLRPRVDTGFLGMI